MGHDAYTISQLVGLLDMLSAHNDRPLSLKGSNQIPHLLSRLHVQTTSRFIQNDSFSLADESHTEGQLSFHASRALFDELVFVLLKLAPGQNVIDLLLLVDRVNCA